MKSSTNKKHNKSKRKLTKSSSLTNNYKLSLSQTDSYNSDSSTNNNINKNNTPHVSVNKNNQSSIVGLPNNTLSNNHFSNGSENCLIDLYYDKIGYEEKKHQQQQLSDRSDSEQQLNREISQIGPLDQNPDFSYKHKFKKKSLSSKSLNKLNLQVENEITNTTSTCTTSKTKNTTTPNKDDYCLFGTTINLTFWKNNTTTTSLYKSSSKSQCLKSSSSTSLNMIKSNNKVRRNNTAPSGRPKTRARRNVTGVCVKVLV